VPVPVRCGVGAGLVVLGRSRGVACAFEPLLATAGVCSEPCTNPAHLLSPHPHPQPRCPQGYFKGIQKIDSIIDKMLQVWGRSVGGGVGCIPHSPTSHHSPPDTCVTFTLFLANTATPPTPQGAARHRHPRLCHRPAVLHAARTGGRQRAHDRQAAAGRTAGGSVRVVCVCVRTLVRVLGGGVESLAVASGVCRRAHCPHSSPLTPTLPLPPPPPPPPPPPTQRTRR